MFSKRLARLVDGLKYSFLEQGVKSRIIGVIGSSELIMVPNDGVLGGVS